MSLKKDAYYFSHDANAQDDPKCMILIDQMGMEGYGIFWALIEKLRSEKDYKLPFAIIPSLARRWGTSKEKVETVIKIYGLFIIEDEDFFSERLLRSMAEKSDKARIGASTKWGLSEVNTAKRSQRLQDARAKATHTKEEWEEMKVWFGECVKCGSKESICKDHITPIYQGGSDGLDNLQPLCQRCNSSKGPNNYDYRIDYCADNQLEMPEKWLRMAANACEMPAERLRMPAIKVKERKVKENILLADKPQKIEKFVKPGKGQITNYLSAEHKIDEFTAMGIADTFLDHFESNGWKVGGKAPMKDWKASMRTWLRNRERYSSNQTSQDRKINKNTFI